MRSGPLGAGLQPSALIGSLNMTSWPNASLLPHFPNLPHIGLPCRAAVEAQAAGQVLRYVQPIRNVAAPISTSSSTAVFNIFITVSAPPQCMPYPKKNSRTRLMIDGLCWLGMDAFCGDMCDMSALGLQAPGRPLCFRCCQRLPSIHGPGSPTQRPPRAKYAPASDPRSAAIELCSCPRSVVAVGFRDAALGLAPCRGWLLPLLP